MALSIFAVSGMKDFGLCLGGQGQQQQQQQPEPELRLKLSKRPRRCMLTFGRRF